MDVLPNDDELLLMELERRDGIYSFIFHELETNKLQTDNHLKIKESSTNLMVNENHIKWELAGESADKKSPLLSATSTFLSTTNSSQSYSNSDSHVKNSTTVFGKSWLQTQITTPVNSNIQFQMPFYGPAYPSFSQICSLRSLNVRRAKSPFSHINTPLVRNRRHKLKETAEYKNYMNGITKIADLRELFPLDPDVHAPFAEVNENLMITKSRGLVVKCSTILK